MATSDHIPVVISLNVDNVPALAVSNVTNTGKLDWPNLTKEEINRYSTATDKLLNNIELPRDALLCYKNSHHCFELCVMYKSFYKYKNKVHNIKPGWNDFVEEHHAAAREAFKLLSESGRPRRGHCLNIENLPVQDLNMRFVLEKERRTR